MNSRERFACAMQHKSPDRMHIDIGATSLTGMRPDCQEGLRRLLGFSGNAAKNDHGIDERILQWAGTDFRSVGAIVDLPIKHTRTISPLTSVVATVMPGRCAAGSCRVQHAVVYQRRRPERSDAYQVVQQNLETWLVRRRAGGLDAGADVVWRVVWDANPGL